MKTQLLLALGVFLAVAYTEMGDVEQAVRWQEKAVELAPDQHHNELQKRLDMYRSETKLE